MDTLRKEAYRHLIYVAMLDMRCSPPTARWWSLSRWKAIYAETLRVKELANTFHNIARYSARNFDGFDETRFWKDIDCVASQWRDPVDYDYRKIFEQYLAGNKWP
jgi:hypothetical protein